MFEFSASDLGHNQHILFAYLSDFPPCLKYTQPIHQFLNYKYHYYYRLVRLSSFAVVRTSRFNYGALSSNVLQWKKSGSQHPLIFSVSPPFVLLSLFVFPSIPGSYSNSLQMTTIVFKPLFDSCLRGQCHTNNLLSEVWRRELALFTYTKAAPVPVTFLAVHLKCHFLKEASPGLLS